MPQTYADILATELGPTQSVMAIMDHTGDQKVTWDRCVPAEVDMARKTFDEWKKKRYMAYKVTDGGKRGEVLSEFDPKAEHIIFSPPMQGGIDASSSGVHCG